MNYKLITIFLLSFLSLLALTGCSGDPDPKDSIILSLEQNVSSLKQEASSLQQDIIELEGENKLLHASIAELNKQVGVGKKYFLEEHRINVAEIKMQASDSLVNRTLMMMLVTFFIVIIASLIVIRVHLWTNRKILKNKKTHEEEKTELNEKHNLSQKLILDLEHQIKSLKRALDDGEKNEVSSLLRTLKSERDLKKDKIGGLNDK